MRRRRARGGGARDVLKSRRGHGGRNAEVRGQEHTASFVEQKSKKIITILFIYIYMFFYIYIYMYSCILFSV